MLFHSLCGLETISSMQSKKETCGSKNWKVLFSNPLTLILIKFDVQNCRITL